ncbi:hypothetical protein NEFER03_0713 [Nematocida sp. LUAm3]|nr:hypothetical protein NEFER03_0713 [Nematocida sp. LUAm3]KAI5175172.1 hypothetical protein NEFER02_1133 [Nematocida sp. LUAm2]KAI5178156.1 hypothetical protein NEFER01_1334 [Nematocida sp. LUAm1]
MESQKECLYPAEQEKRSEGISSVERTIGIKIIYNYAEKNLLLPVESDLLERIKKEASEIFSVSSVRLEVEGKPLLSAQQIISCSSPITILGIKNKCILSNCCNRASSITCKYCEKAFCSKHTIPEEHACEHIDKCKEEAITNNRKKLLQGSSKRYP